MEGAMTQYAKDIKPGMPVVGSNGTEFGIVDSLDGENSIKLKPDEHGKHHWIPISWVTGVDRVVNIDRPFHQAMEEWSDSNPEDL